MLAVELFGQHLHPKKGFFPQAKPFAPQKNRLKSPFLHFLNDFFDLKIKNYI